MRRIPVSFWKQIRLSLLIGAGVASVLLMTRSGQLFASTRLQANDVYVVASAATDNIRLIALDDASFERYGRSLTEWDRGVFADLVTWLHEAGVRVITIDVLFNQPTAADALFAQAVRDARSGDMRVRTILPVVGAEIDSFAETDQQLHYSALIRPSQTLADAVDYLGVINVFPDVDSAVRRQITQIKVGDDTYYSLALATYLAYLRVPSSAASQLVSMGDNTLTIGNDRVLQVDENGFWLPNYFRNSAAEGDDIYPTYSLVDVLDGRIDPSVFADKIVLIGTLNTSASNDMYHVPTSPNGRRLAGVEIHAQAVETLIQNLPLYVQSFSVEILIIFVLAMLSSVIYGQLRWYWVLIVGFGLSAGWIVIVFASFSLHRVLINLTLSLLALVLPMVITLIIHFAHEARQRRENEFFLNSVVDVSQQQMALDRILPRVGEDLRRLHRASMVVIWLHDEPSGALLPTYTWKSEESLALRPAQTLALRVRETRHTISDGNWLGIPVLWQGRVLAVFTSCRIRTTRLRQTARQMIEMLATQIAPSLDNAILFDKVRRQNTLLEAVFAGSPAGLIVLDADLRLTRASRALDEAFGVLCGECIGTSLGDLFKRANVAEETAQLLQHHVHTWQPFREQINHRRRTLIVDAAPLSDLSEWVIIFNDVTSLADLSEFKTQMIRMASHDLNNPLTNVIATAEIMLDPEFGQPMEERVREAMERIRRNSHHMRQIIEDILNLERARAPVLTKQEFDFAAVVAETCNQLDPEARIKQQNLEVDIETNLAYVHGDRAQLRQVAQNLIGNAIKYTPDGGTVSVRVTNDVDRLLMEVEDTGYGIPESAQSRIFQEFFRAKSSATTGIPGTGLGLSLVKSVVSAHNGRVWFRSVEGEGSTFFVELPFAEESE